MGREELSLKRNDIFKAKDLGLVETVQRILDRNRVTATIEGGLKRNLENGFPRTYRDIDLKVEPRGDRGTPEFENYADTIRDLYELSERDSSDLRIEDITEGFATYVDVEVAYRFRVFSPETRTTVDITFGKHRDSKGDLRGEEGIETPVTCYPMMLIAKKPGTYKFD